ncbi:hypothetical protein BKA70DRAFT_1222786 [Coprinopsis sp. MPI-PUGE-AT-0042]|nr:hypothetical protein BKA70DRAFT_1222786 [Coprinopsis sp. MPI-PUGE-AT-0042]
MRFLHCDPLSGQATPLHGVNFRGLPPKVDPTTPNKVLLCRRKRASLEAYFHHPYQKHQWYLNPLGEEVYRIQAPSFDSCVDEGKEFLELFLRSGRVFSSHLFLAAWTKLDWAVEMAWTGKEERLELRAETFPVYCATATHLWTESCFNPAKTFLSLFSLSRKALVRVLISTPTFLLPPFLPSLVWDVGCRGQQRYSSTPDFAWLPHPRAIASLALLPSSTYVSSVDCAFRMFEPRYQIWMPSSIWYRRSSQAMAVSRISSKGSGNSEGGAVLQVEERQRVDSPAPTMSFWNHNLDEFNITLQAGASLIILDDAMSLCVFSSVSVVQVYIALALVRHWKARHSERPARTLFNQARPGYAFVETSRFSFMVNVPSRTAVDKLFMFGGIKWLSGHNSFKRCCDLSMPSHAWSTMGNGACRSSSAGFTCMTIGTDATRAPAVYTTAVSVGSYISLGTNLIISSSLIIWLWRRKKEVKYLMGGAAVGKTQIPYSRLINVLVQSALPPLLLGLLHMVLYIYRRTQAIRSPSSLGALWISFTVLAPQIITLHAIQSRQQAKSAQTLGQIPTGPIVFISAGTLSKGIESETLDTQSA